MELLKEALVNLVIELDTLGLSDMPGDTMADLRQRVEDARAAIQEATT